MTFGNDATDRGTGTTRFGMDRVVGAIETLEWLLPEEQPTLECQAALLYDGRLLAGPGPTLNRRKEIGSTDLRCVEVDRRFVITRGATT